MTNVCSCSRVFFTFFMCLAASRTSVADYIKVNTGPTKDGTKFITVETSDGKKHDISVPVTAGMSPEVVTGKIIDELNLNGITATEGALGLVSAVRVTGKVTEIVTDSAQTDTIADLGTDIGPIFTAMNLAGALSGLDVLGNPSIFTGGFELTSATLGNVAISTTLSASDFVGGPTAPAVLQRQFMDLSTQLLTLAPSLAGNLSLDLSNSRILFGMPGGLTFESVTVGTTDVSGTIGATSNVVPEVSSFTMLWSGSVLLALHFARRHFGQHRRPA